MQDEALHRKKRTPTWTGVRTKGIINTSYTCQERFSLGKSDGYVPYGGTYPAIWVQVFDLARVPAFFWIYYRI
jgi:hypothetical protein